MYGYYDGISEEIKNMSLEELEMAIKEEEEKCKEMNKEEMSKVKGQKKPTENLPTFQND